MAGLKQVRVIKRGQSAETGAAAHGQAESRGRDKGRAPRDVVSGWVREHVRRTEEFRHNYARLLRDSGFVFPRTCGKESV
ncbi:MAG TPA: hypothetical protein VFA21_05085 [Pyrinomonadaceae bacterium]|nr:hypothetical protein [Pyrinomonadaceae bacterium]